MSINIDIDDYLETIVLDIADTDFSGFLRLAEKYGGIPQGQGRRLDAVWERLQTHYGLPWQVATGLMGRVVRKDTGENNTALDPAWTDEEVVEWRTAGYYTALGLASLIRAKRLVEARYPDEDLVEVL